MSAVEIRLSHGNLSREMGAMRVWLDQRRFEVSGFSCRDEGGGVLVSLEFTRAHEAQAFADHFVLRAARALATDVAAELPAGIVAGLPLNGVIG